MTTSIWQGTFEMPSYPALDANLECDVCVVGAGISPATGSVFDPKVKAFEGSNITL